MISRCRENERRALMEFKAGVVDDFGVLSSWGNNSNEEDCCKWKGIRCSKLTGYVTLVNIPGYYYTHAPNSGELFWVGLSGKISPSLSELKHLRYLNLSNNWFHGGVPPQLGNLTDLRSLVLGDRFSTMALEDLDWLSHLRLLTYLDLSHIILTKSGDWLNQINKLSSLTHLFLRLCMLPESLPINNTSSLTSLSVVDLSFNHFVSPSSYTWLFNLSSSLISIQLPRNYFFRGSVPEDFGSMMCLETLILSGCELEGMLPDSFRNLSRLTTLDLSFNNFNGSLSKFLHPLAAIKDNSLEVLRLKGNQLGQSLPSYLARFQSLRTLSISDNKLSGPFLDNFGQVSSSLVHLDLSNNQITGTFPNLTLFSSLESLALDNNKLEGEIPAAYLSNLSKLSSLDLSYNSLSLNFSFHWLPPFKLDKVLLKNCTLGPNFPNWMKSQHNISVLDISHTRISDTIPLWFWDLSPGLKNLNMSNNQIKGIVPSISLAYPEIHWIDLSHNLLQGPIPPLPVNLGFLDLAHNMFTGSLSFVCKSPYTQLIYLDLSDNKISGELPTDCLMNIRTLSTLNLANNDFSGNIPSSIGLQDQLTILQLRNNSFTGQLPLSLMNNTKLRLLDLSENKLSGKVPTWTGTHLTSLIVLSLRDNEFSGSIPPQICHLTNVQVLDLSQNNLMGSIPHCINNFTSLIERIDERTIQDSFSNDYGDDKSKYVNAVVQWKGVASAYERTLKYLKLIDLSSNRLVGQIPVEFASLKGLISLNLSGNSLTGNIIPKIGQMENLESLDLSRNHLSGEIPSGLASLTLLSVLDVSNNNLTGKIPSSTQLQSFHPSDFAGNEHLCGPPLSNKCGGVISLPTRQDENNEERDVKFWKIGLYLSVVLGFGTGFWGFVGPVMLRRTWRVSYYKLLDNITQWIYVTTILHITRLRRKFYG